MIITFLTQILTVYKSSIIAANFGANVELDAYNFANNISLFFLTFVGSGLTTVVIPAYVKKLDKKAIDTFLSVVFLITGILLAVTFLFRGQIVDLLTNREPEFKVLVCGVMLLTILIQFFPALLGVTTAHFQCIGKFNIPKIVLLLSNVGIILTLTIWKTFSLYEYLYVLFAGALFQFIVDLVIAIKNGFSYHFSLNIHNPRYKETMRIFIPTLLSTGVYKINTMIDTLLSSNIGAGQLTILTYANMIVTMVNSLIIGNLVIYAYPKIVQIVAKNETVAQNALWKYSIAFHKVVCLILVGFFCAGREFVGLLFEHGEFSHSAATIVFYCMCIYMIDQQFNIIRDLIYRYFFAHGDTKYTMKNGVFSSIVNIFLSIILVQYIGLFGIVIGTSVAGLASLISILIKFRRKYGFLAPYKPYLIEFLKNLLMATATICIIFIIKQSMPPLNYLLTFVLYGILCCIIYAIGMLIIKK